MNREVLLEIVAALRRLHEIGSDDPDLRPQYGLCGQEITHPDLDLGYGVRIDEAFYQASEWSRLCDLWVDWPEYSGRLTYPVRHQTLSPALAYETAYNVWVGKYGKRRRDLCLWLANKIEDKFLKEKEGES